MTTPASSHASISHKPFWRRQQFWRFALPTIAVACAIAAALLVYDAFVGRGDVHQTAGSVTTYPEPPKPKTVALGNDVKSLARRFVLTAVARKDLAEAYAFSGPHIREGMTLEEWRTGNIAVVPYKITPETTAHLKIDESYATSAKLEVLLSTPHVKSQIFFMDLVKTHGKWLVDAWVPRNPPPIPGNVGH